MLVLSAVMSAALLTAALALTASGPATCARPTGNGVHLALHPTACRPRVDADALRAEMIGAAAQLARPVEPRVRQERAGFRAAASPAGPAGVSADRWDGGT